MRDVRVLAACGLMVSAALSPAVLNAQTAPAAPSSPAVVPARAPQQQTSDKPVTIAMIAAIGDRLQYVRQKQQVGSHLEPYTRATLQVPDQTLNWAALRGLDRAIGEQNPQARRVLLNFQPAEADYQRILNARNDQRGAVTSEVLLAYLRAMPQRQEWDQIMTITPAYRFSEVNGMGSKFAGVGVYVQPLARQSADFSEGGGVVVDAIGPDGDDTTFAPRPGGTWERTRSSIYVAPYFYFELTTYDAKTLDVIKREQRLDYRKLYDRSVATLDVGKMFTPEQLSEQVDRLVETSVVRAVLGEGRVERGDVKQIPKTN
ncbi:MAG TPA: hypothetical protein VFK82_05310 [Burkholderiaceae bacterium]|nr:hypothetical protein [Burkholderiaceae bacterium]